MRIKALFLSPYSKYIWIILMLMAWELTAQLAPVSPLAFPSLELILAALIDSISNGDLVRQMVFSLGLILIGLGIGVALAFLMSFLAVVSPVFASFTDTCVSIFHPLPGIALLPLIILWIGTGSAAILFIIVHSVLWPMILNMSAGFKAIPAVYKKIGENYGFNTFQSIIRIFVPASLSFLIAGLKISWARGWRAAISAEMIFGASGGIGGIGWYIFNKRVFMDTAGVYAGILMIIAVGIFVEDFVFGKLEKNTINKWGVA
ncbi:ABC transporter permease [Acetobacterium sp.]|uniref:ABC transporter permease n=1 Tax=Acetobacterium sp. TaxID=1872094 RepID=UPI0035931987